jgi:chromosome segregation ATPase
MSDSIEDLNRRIEDLTRTLSSLRESNAKYIADLSLSKVRYANLKHTLSNEWDDSEGTTEELKDVIKDLAKDIADKDEKIKDLENNSTNKDSKRLRNTIIMGALAVISGGIGGSLLAPLIGMGVSCL